MRTILITAFLIVSAALHAQDRTLRVDYVFTGTAKASEICLDEMTCFDGWAGRRHNLDSVALKGNGQICMKDIQTGKVLYRQSFSTLFQEWQATEEATRVRKSFENVFLLPMPDAKAEVNVEIYDFYGNVPSCLLIRRDVFCRLLDTVFTLFPYPVQKLSEAAVSAGVAIRTVPGIIEKPACNREFQLVPFQGKGLLRGKNRTGKKLLVITHDLSWTGAPVVLSEACSNVLKPAGYELLVLSLKDGPLAEKYRENGISVMVVPEVALQDSDLLLSLVQPFDAVLVNTIVPYAGIHLLNSLKKPVLSGYNKGSLSTYDRFQNFLSKFRQKNSVHNSLWTLFTCLAVRREVPRES